MPTTYSCASGETSPPETAGGSRRRLTAKRRRLILPTYVNRICHDYTRGSGTYNKLITERFGIRLEDGFTHRGSTHGAQNLKIQIQYEAILDPDHEFLMSL